MKKMIRISVTEPQYVVSTGVAFSQVNDWYGHCVRDLKMDIVYPDKREKLLPCVLWICGGGWLTMNRSAHLAYLSKLALSGFTVASMEYRTSNEAPFPAQLIDVKSAVRYLKANAARYSIDPDRIGVMGESAGGHLTALAALTGETREFDEGAYLEYSSAVQAAAPWYVPADFFLFPQRSTPSGASPESLLIGAKAEDSPALVKKANPVSYVTENAPPFLLLHGTDDHTVPFSQSEALYEKLTEKGNDVTLYAIEGADHADLAFFQPEIWDIIQTFFKEKL